MTVADVAAAQFRATGELPADDRAAALMAQALRSACDEIPGDAIEEWRAAFDRFLDAETDGDRRAARFAIMSVRLGRPVP